MWGDDIFDLYAFADYSGSSNEAVQRKRIALSVINEKVSETPKTEIGFTREILLQKIEQLLVEATENGRCAIFGFDHNYSFPVGFYKAVTGRSWTTWREILDLLVEGSKELPSIEDAPREWAKTANDTIAERFGIRTGGPFWGMHFDYQMKKPDFPHGHILKEKRLIEERSPRMKSIFQLGGIGAVGLQSLHGMVSLHKLLVFCRNQHIPLHCWPFDGWEIPGNSHVLVEMYPTLFNQGPRTDQNDAEACSVWLADQDKSGQLDRWFHPGLNLEEQKRARLEGWSLGI